MLHLSYWGRCTSNCFCSNLHYCVVNGKLALGQLRQFSSQMMNYKNQTVNTLLKPFAVIFNLTLAFIK